MTSPATDRYAGPSGGTGEHRLPRACPWSAAARRPAREPARPGGPVVDGPALASAVVAAVRHSGTHALAPDLLARLAAVRDRGVGDPLLAALLDSVLGRHDGRFRNRTYLALPVIEELMAATGTDPDAMAALLMADVVRHEVAATRLPPGAAPSDRPDPRTLRSRLRHARRFVDLCRGAAADPEDPAAGLPEPHGALADWLPATALPVTTLHDEYFFLRVLQCHELTFAVLARDVRAATAALRQGDLASATAHLRHADDVFARAALLFRVVATMRPETFHAFRVFTDGASAIQSDQYKRFEAACRRPDAARLASDAFTNVPVVLAEVLAGQDDLTAAALAAHDEDPDAPGWAAFDAAVRTLEASHQRWKTTHVGLATRLLGDARGSGSTVGVPYLQGCLRNRLFTPTA
jgi:tryptophan 2,3-dioxygenase